jgi:hypothetical protein
MNDAEILAWAQAVERMREMLIVTLEESPGDFPFGFTVTEQEAQASLLYVLGLDQFPPYAPSIEHTP